MDYLVGKVINNRYEIVEKVGVGGMATVYKAKCKVLDRFVAIKILKDSLKNDVDVVKKFNTESRAAARLSHPNIVQVYDVSESGDLDYIVMEYVDGITLKEYIMRKGHLEINEACDIAAQVGRALACAHANGIIHRDIKPHNVLMAQDGTVKVADFGIAQASTSETMVAGGGAMGSVHYLSPEQARGGYTNERSDIYSLGVVLYEMLSGEVPFDGANPVAIALAKLENDPEDIRQKCSHYIPDSVCEITMKAISKEQHSRYQSATEMVADLEKVMGVSKTGEKELQEKFETKRLYNKTRNETNMKKKTKRKNRKNKNNRIIAIAVAILVVLAGIFWLWQFFSATPEVKVPDIIGYSPEEAEYMLKQEGLEIDKNFSYDESDKIPEGMVMGQNPKGGETVKKGRTIKITISTGPKGEETEVPDVVGLDEKEAERQIKKAGFKCVVVPEENEDVELGKIIKQDPDGKETAKKGTEVTIYVSAASEETEVPNVMGKSKEEAIKILTDAGFAIGEMTEGESNEKKGTVISQTPEAKELAYAGAKVSLMLSKGPLTKKYSIKLPDGEGTVLITVKADGEEVYRKQHNKSEYSIWVDVPAREGIDLEVYADGVLIKK